MSRHVSPAANSLHCSIAVGRVRYLSPDIPAQLQAAWISGTDCYLQLLVTADLVLFCDVLPCFADNDSTIPIAQKSLLGFMRRSQIYIYRLPPLPPTSSTRGLDDWMVGCPRARFTGEKNCAILPPRGKNCHGFTWSFMDFH